MTNVYGAELIIPASLPQAPFYQADTFSKQNATIEHFDNIYFLLPQYSTCVYHLCLQGRIPKDSLIWRPDDTCHDVATRYLTRILNHIQQHYPFWHRHNGADHLLIFAWDGGADLIGRETHLRARLSEAIHLVHLGSPNRTETFRPGHDITIPAFRDFRWAQELLGEHSKRPTRFFSWLTRRKDDDRRPIYAYFRGTINKEWLYSHGVRQQLPALAATNPDRYFIKNGHSDFYWTEVVRARFILCPAGWEPWSPRLFDGIVSGALPILLTDQWIVPFERESNKQGVLKERIPFEQFLLRTDIANLNGLLDGLTVEEEAAMRMTMASVAHRFIYNLIPQPQDALWTIAEILSHRKGSVQQYELPDLNSEDDSDVHEHHEEEEEEEEEDYNEDDDGTSGIPVGRVDL